MSSEKLAKADSLITGIICDALFSKAAVNEIEAYQTIYKRALKKALQNQYAKFEDFIRTDDVEKVIRVAEKILGKELAEKLEPETEKYLSHAFRAGKAMQGVPENIQMLFNEAHELALNWLIEHDRFWIGKTFPKHLSKSFKDTITNGLKDGLGRKDIARRLKELTFGKANIPGKIELYNRVVSASVSRARNWGSLFSLKEAEVETYIWRSVNDERTCERCRYLDGTEFSVNNMMSLVKKAINGAPEDIEKLSPWPTHDLKRDDYYIRTASGREYIRGKPVSWLEKRGIGIPPLHSGCRCTTIIT